MEELNDNEFDLLDELYFVQSYQELRQALSWSEELLNTVLKSLLQKPYIKFLEDHDTEIDTKQALQLPSSAYQELLFLATKQGLMIHNGF